jgi:hypothetical protein
MSRNVRFALCSLCILVLAIPVVQPLLRDQLTVGYDNVLHMWRAVEVDALWDAGLFFSRWQPHMVFGFGYPALLFQPPLSPMLAAVFHRIGLGWASAVNAVFVVGTVLSGWTMWLLVREFWGDGPGVVAAAAIMNLPFHAYINFHRASMSEALAWAFPGLILWGLLRWQRNGERWGLLAAAGGQVGMLLSHNVSAYLFLPIPALAVVAIGLSRRSWRVLVRGALVQALSIGAAAFSWLPSIIERSNVQFGRALDYDYSASFVPLDYLMEPPRVADPTFINPWLPKGIGLMVAILALPALVACVRDPSRDRRLWLAAMVFGAVSCIWVATPFARFLWRWVPQLHYLQFPWRFLTPAAFGIAVAAGAGVARVERRFRFAAPLSVALLVVGSLGWLYPPHTALAQPATLSGMLAYERTVGWIGSTTFGELLPVWVQSLPQTTVLDDDIVAGRELVRLRPEDLPDATRILSADYGATSAHITLEITEPFRARYLAFYYPGWRVRIDGEMVSIDPTDPDGLIAFDVPAGEHSIEVRFTETPLRLAADAISVASIALLLLCALVPLRPCFPATLQPSTANSQPATSNLQPSTSSPEPSAPDLQPSTSKPELAEHSPQPAILTLLLVSAALVLLKVAIIDRVPNPLRRSNLEGEQLLRVDVPSDVTFDGQFRLLGYDGLPETVPGDESIAVGTYWQDNVPGGPNYWVGLSLRDEDGLNWHVSDLRPPRWHRVPVEAYLWAPDEYARIAYELQLLPGIPPGTYTLALGVFDRNSLRPFSAQDANGQDLGLEIDLAQVRVERPADPFTQGEVSPQHASRTDLGPLRLVGYNVDREEAVPGDPFLLTLFWQALEAPSQDLSTRLSLLDPTSGEIVAFDLTPVTRFPTGDWESGDLWRGQHLLRLPASLESGTYRWQLQLCGGQEVDCDAVGGPLALGALSIQAPERIWEPPPLDLEADTQLGDVASLLGATVEPATCDLQSATCNLQPTASNLQIALAWRSEAETMVSYRVFLHLLGPDGASVAQSDGEPAGWTRPTTGWLPGEVVLDRRVLDLPAEMTPGEYRLIAGLYTLEGGRLLTPQGEDVVLLARFEVRDTP